MSRGIDRLKEFSERHESGREPDSVWRDRFLGYCKADVEATRRAAYRLMYGRMPEDDGPEVNLCRFFRNFPDGTNGGMEPYLDFGLPW